MARSVCPDCAKILTEAFLDEPLQDAYAALYAVLHADDDPSPNNQS